MNERGRMIGGGGRANDKQKGGNPRMDGSDRLGDDGRGGIGI